jgi:hypothetical protein
LKEAYRSADISSSYHSSFKKLVQEWHGTLDTIQVDSTDRRNAERLYGMASLFEQQCPHVQSPFARQWDQFQLNMARKDTARALQHLNKANQLAKDAGPVSTQWAYLHLKTGGAARVAQSAVKTDSLAETLLLYADALKLNGEPEKSQAYIAEAIQRVQDSPNEGTKDALRIRLDSVQWNYHRAIVYEQTVVKDSVFRKMDHRTQVRALHEALIRGQEELVKRYGFLINTEKFTPLYLDTYLDGIKHLAYLGNITLARRWLNVLELIDLRLRYKERIEQAREFVLYVQQN